MDGLAVRLNLTAIGGGDGSRIGAKNDCEGNLEGGGLHLRGWDEMRGVRE